MSARQVGERPKFKEIEEIAQKHSNQSPRRSIIDDTILYTPRKSKRPNLPNFRKTCNFIGCCGCWKEKSENALRQFERHLLLADAKCALTGLFVQRVAAYNSRSCMQNSDEFFFFFGICETFRAFPPEPRKIRDYYFRGTGDCLKRANRDQTVQSRVLKT